MNIGILIQDLEEQELEIKEELRKRGIESELMDVRKTSLEELEKKDLILNRVFASVANRDYRDNFKALEYLKRLEKHEKKCINSYFTTLCDYNKYFSSKIMEDNHIQNPKTFLIQNYSHLQEARSFFKEKGFEKNKPIVLKRNIGGRGKDIFLIKNQKELDKKVKELLSNESYQGGYILQEFIESKLPHDYRISVIGGRIVYSMTRSFIETGDPLPWISSMSLGSTEKVVETPEEIKELALNATKSIGAFFNDVDIIVGERGPYIIENNPTPNFANRKPENNKNVKKKIVIENLVNEIKSSLEN